jgi:hypothetical protein
MLPEGGIALLAHSGFSAGRAIACRRVAKAGVEVGSERGALLRSGGTRGGANPPSRRNQGNCILLGFAQGRRSLHPTDEGLSVGAPVLMVAST